MSSAICFNLDQSKILSSRNGLTLYQHMALHADDKINVAQMINSADKRLDNKLFKKETKLIFQQSFQKS